MSADNLRFTHEGDGFDQAITSQALGLAIHILSSATGSEKEIEPTLRFLRSAVAKGTGTLRVGKKRIGGVGLATDIIKEHMEENPDDAQVLVPLHNALRTVSFSASFIKSKG